MSTFGFDEGKNKIEVVEASKIYTNVTTTQAIANGNEATYSFSVTDENFTIDNTVVIGVTYQMVGDTRTYSAMNHSGNPAQVRVSFTARDGGGISVGVRVQRSYKDTKNIAYKTRVVLMRVD